MYGFSGGDGSSIYLQNPWPFKSPSSSTSTSSAPQDGLTVGGSFGNVPFDFNVPHTKVMSTAGDTYNSIKDFFSRPNYNETDFDEGSETIRVWDSSWDTVDHSIDVGSNPTPEEVEKWQDIGASLTKEQWNSLIGSEGTVTRESVQEKYPDVVENYVPGASSQVSGKVFGHDVSGSKLDLNNIEFTDKDGNVSNNNIANLVPGVDAGIAASYSFIPNKIDISNQNKDTLSSIQSTLGTDTSKYKVNESLNIKEPFIQNDVFLKLDAVSRKTGTSDQPEFLKLYAISGINEHVRGDSSRSYSNPFGKDQYSAVNGKQTTAFKPRSSEYKDTDYDGTFFLDENKQQIASDTSFNSFNPEVRGKLYDPEFHSKDSEGNVLGIKDKYNIGVGEFALVSGSRVGKNDHGGEFTSYYTNVGPVSDLILDGSNPFTTEVLNKVVENFKDYYSDNSTRGNVEYDTGWLEIGTAGWRDNRVLQGAALGVTTFNNSQIDSYLTEATVQKDLQDFIGSNGNFTDEQSAALTNKIWESGVDDLGKINPEYFTGFVGEVNTAEDYFTSDKVKDIMGPDLNSEGSVWNTDEDGNVLFDIGTPEEIAATDNDTDEIIPTDVTVNEENIDTVVDNAIDGTTDYTNEEAAATQPEVNDTVTFDNTTNPTYVDSGGNEVEIETTSDGTPLITGDVDTSTNEIQDDVASTLAKDLDNIPGTDTGTDTDTDTGTGVSDEADINGLEAEDDGVGISSGANDNSVNTVPEKVPDPNNPGHYTDGTLISEEPTPEPTTPEPTFFTEAEIADINKYAAGLGLTGEDTILRDFDIDSEGFQAVIDRLNKDFATDFQKENLLAEEGWEGDMDHWFDRIIGTLYKDESTAALTNQVLQSILDELTIVQGLEKEFSALRPDVVLDPELLQTSLDEYLRANEAIGREPKYTINEDGTLSGLDTDVVGGVTNAELRDTEAETIAGEPEFIPELQKGVLDIRSPEDTGSRDIGETFNREGERISNIRKEQLNQMYEGAGISKSDTSFYENNEYNPLDTNKDSIVDQLEVMDKASSGEVTFQDAISDIGKYDRLADATPIDVDPEKGLPKLNRKPLSSGQSYNVTAEASDPIRTQERKLPQNNPIPEIMGPPSPSTTGAKLPELRQPLSLTGAKLPPGIMGPPSPTGAKPAWQQLGYGSQEQYGSTRERPWNKMSQTHLDQLKKDGIDTSYTESLREQDAKAKYAGTPAKNAASPQERIKAQAERRRIQAGRAKEAFTPKVGSYQ